jgi:hypothetical protein
MATNRIDDQEIGMLCLHLIQLLLVYMGSPQKTDHIVR